MYRDLEPETWKNGQKLDENSLVAGLIEGRFEATAPFCGENDFLDPFITPADMVHVVDCDSSQMVAVEEVRRGRNLVIQGPPGTGKSQTIANLIATAVKDGKRVLFVAEKMAALEVVKRRLDNVGLGDMCLELHSNKVNKRLVVQNLGSTLSLARPKSDQLEKLIENLTGVRQRLNSYVQELHKPIMPAGVTPYHAIGELVRARRLGIQPPAFRLETALKWSKSEFQDRLNLLEEVVVHLKPLGSPSEHPWRGVMSEVLLPSDVQQLAQQIPNAMKLLDEAITTITALAHQLHTSAADNTLGNLVLMKLGQYFVSAPQMDRKSFASDVWKSKRADISNLIRLGQKLQELKSKLDGVVTEMAWTIDANKTYSDLVAYGRSMFRWFRSNYRTAVASLNGLFTITPPKALKSRLEILDGLIAAQGAQRELDNQPGTELGQQAFGSYWHGAQSDWQVLAAIEAWDQKCLDAKLPSGFRRIFAALADARQTGATVAKLKNELSRFFDLAMNIFKSVQLDSNIAFGAEDLRTVSLFELRSRLAAWANQTELLSKWIQFRSRWDQLRAKGLTEFADLLYRGEIKPDTAVGGLRTAYYNELVREILRNSPAIAHFDGESHCQILDQFRQFDQDRIKLARSEVALAHFSRIPTEDAKNQELATVRREANKKRAHKPVRKLLSEAGQVVQSIKPVFMMSPLSVAQFLEPGVLSFDLLLIDEASQVKPVDALGAIARAKQIVIVGDDKQLPPTRFFDKVLDEGEQSDENDEFSAGDVESVLGLCCAQGLPSRMLRWHYRSRHHSLIAVSNREFYDNRLFIVPSPMTQSDKLGLRFQHVANGTFDRGGSTTNRIEAQAVAAAVMKHSRENANLSLGVAAFSVAQRDAILDELELLRRGNQESEKFFSATAEEPFFVKNLENIQGDERDVIFISVGYGRDTSGYMAMSFGPLQNDGGERRLNVLISRAKMRCEVFSSITADDIDLSRARSRGVAAFKTFLSYAQNGWLEIAKPTGGDFGSDFEEEVAHALTGLGYNVESQVGIAGFFIDLAIHDPNTPGRFLLGIECDGATYHSSRSSRDRDRLRQQVLEDRGWKIHRIWSTDWFHRPQEQLRKTVAAIERAQSEIVVPCAGPGGKC